MRLTLLWGGLLLCALVPLEAATVADAARGGGATYKGRTAQHRPVKFKVRGNKLRILHFKVALRCSDGSTLIDTESGFQTTPIRGNGKFKVHQVGRTDVVRMKGKVRGRKIRGKLRVTDRLGKRIKCHSKRIKFTAKRRGH